MIATHSSIKFILVWFPNCHMIDYIQCLTELMCHLTWVAKFRYDDKTYNYNTFHINIHPQNHPYIIHIIRGHILSTLIYRLCFIWYAEVINRVATCSLDDGYCEVDHEGQLNLYSCCTDRYSALFDVLDH